MIDSTLSWLIGPALTGPFVLLVIAFAALVATRLSRLVIRRLIRRLSTNSLRFAKLPGASAGIWRARAHRVGDDAIGSVETVEQRRRQRVEAASRMVNHLVSVVIWIVGAIVAFHVLDIDPAFFLSSAGFIGAGLAIGGQHKVNDYLTGLSVHFEDRYGVGDEILADVGWPDQLRGVVDHIGLFSTRVRDDRSTLHLPNSALASVCNLSQEAAASTLRVRVPPDTDGSDAADVLRGLAGTEGLTDLVFVGDLATTAAATGEIEVAVQTAQRLDDRHREHLVGRVEQVLGRSDPRSTVDADDRPR